MKLTGLFTETIINAYLNLKTYIKIKILKEKFGDDEPDTSDMSLVLEDNFEKFDMNKWRVGQPWGDYHPNYAYQYYGSDSVRIEERNLVLEQKYLPKTFTNSDGKSIEIPYSVGLVSSIESYGYGFYQFVVKLPNGAGLWPAVWLSCVDSWPPEIDINESYSDKNGSYGCRLESNLHFDFEPNKKSLGASSHYVYDTDKMIVMSCWWSRNFIKIYYNGHLVRQITSGEITKWFRNKKMTIILNNGVRPEFADSITQQTSKFHVYSVKYYR